MKKIFIFILTTFTFLLRADLLNGPYSNESKELLRLAQDPTLPIPDKLKDQTDNLELFRMVLNVVNNPDTTAFGYGPLRELIKENKAYAEALIQNIKEKNIKLKSPKKRPASKFTFSPADYQFYLLARTAIVAGEMELFKKILPKLQQETKMILVEDLLTDRLFSKAPEEKKQFDLILKFLKEIFNQNKNEGLDDTFADFSVASSLNFDEYDRKIMDLFINLGANVNFVNKQKKEGFGWFKEPNVTILDVLNKRITTDEFFKDHPEDIIIAADYLKSKGAKTYAALKKS
jgi:hypothetical protein